MSVAIKVTGVKTMDKMLKTLQYKVRQKVMRKGMRRFTALVRNRARELAPVRTGNLKKSITSKTSSRAKTGMIIGRVYVDPTKKGVHYGHFAEWGSDKQPASRMMTRAFEEFDDPDLFAAIVMAAFQEETKKLGLGK
jgi:HK97 gp10 family phage protein